MSAIRCQSIVPIRHECATTLFVQNGHTHTYILYVMMIAVHNYTTYLPREQLVMTSESGDGVNWEWAFASLLTSLPRTADLKCSEPNAQSRRSFYLVAQMIALSVGQGYKL